MIDISLLLYCSTVIIIINVIIIIIPTIMIMNVVIIINNFVIIIIIIIPTIIIVPVFDTSVNIVAIIMILYYHIIILNNDRYYRRLTFSLLCTSSLFTLVFSFNLLVYSYSSFPPIALLILGKEYVSKGVSVRAGLTDLLDRVGMQSGMYGTDPNNINGQTGGEGGIPTNSGSISYIPNNFCSLSFTSIIQFLLF